MGIGYHVKKITVRFAQKNNIFFFTIMIMAIKKKKTWDESGH